MLTVGGAISGILRDRQRALHQRAGDREEDRQHRREDRPVDEEMREAHPASPPPARGRSDGSRPARAATVTPARTNGLARPAITTRSVGVRPEAMTRSPQRHAAQCHRLGDDLVVLADGQHDLLRLVGHHRGIRDQQRIERAAIEPQPPERAGRQEEVLVVEDRPAADRAGMRVDLVVDEIHDAAMRANSVSSASRTFTGLATSRDDGRCPSTLSRV